MNQFPPGARAPEYPIEAFSKIRRDFRFQVFFIYQFPPAPEYPSRPFLIFTKVCVDIHNFVFIASVIDTADKLFTGVNDTSEKLSPVLLVPALNYCKCR
jgi:hypothetical protein